MSTSFPEGVSFRAQWPLDALADPKHVNAMLASYGIPASVDGEPLPHDGTVYLLLGYIGMPVVIDEVDAARMNGEPVPVRVHAAIAMTEVRARELHEMLGKHLGITPAEGDEGGGAS